MTSLQGSPPPVDPNEPIPVSDGCERFLRHKEGHVAEGTVETYYWSLKPFREWCEEIDVETLDELTGRHMDAYEDWQQQQVAKTTVKNRMKDLRNAVRYWEQIGAVEEGLAEKTPVRYPDKAEEVRDETLFYEDAVPLLGWYASGSRAGSRHHALLELAWNTAARASGIRALDLRDFYPDEGVVWFRSRPDMDTRLKNGIHSERVVSISPRVVAALETYIRENRNSVRDDYGREPLLTSTQGRPAAGTLRQWTYKLTRPCMYGHCPHNRDPENCEATTRQHESKCPSSKSTHPIRKGSISWHLSNHVPISVVESRCDASREVIERHYDMRSPKDRAMDRRTSVLPNLSYE